MLEAGQVSDQFYTLEKIIPQTTLSRMARFLNLNSVPVPGSDAMFV